MLTFTCGWFDAGFADWSWAAIPWAKVSTRKALKTVGERILGTAKF
jgi:hypothetical protein